MPRARSRVAEVQAQFGKSALEERLLPQIPAASVNPSVLQNARPSRTPTTSFRRKRSAQGISGTVLVEVTVAHDGRARIARVWYSLPANLFDDGGTASCMRQHYISRRKRMVWRLRAPSASK